MSNFPPQSTGSQYENPQGVGSVSPLDKNGLGIAGFITSIAGIVTCGSLSLIGVIISAIALKKEPKGMAIAGLIIGLVGIVELIACIFLFFAMYQLTSGIGIAVQSAATMASMQGEAVKISQEWKDSGEIPNNDVADQLIKSATDMWGNQIAYETDGSSFTLRSSGADGTMQTPDDITIGPFADPDSAMDLQFDPTDFEDFDIDDMDVGSDDDKVDPSDDTELKINLYLK